MLNERGRYGMRVLGGAGGRKGEDEVGDGVAD